ncbi:putative phosphogluconate dehydrogenase (NADP(+)-dependent, decarboxylating) [Helianthus anomalus]
MYLSASLIKFLEGTRRIVQHWNKKLLGRLRAFDRHCNCATWCWKTLGRCGLRCPRQEKARRKLFLLTKRFISKMFLRGPQVRDSRFLSGLKDECVEAAKVFKSGGLDDILVNEKVEKDKLINDVR